MFDFDTRIPPASPVWPLSPRFVAILMDVHLYVALAADFIMREFLLKPKRREGRRTVRTLPVLRRQVAHRSRQVSWLRGHSICRGPLHPSPAQAAEWYYETVFLVTVAGPRRVSPASLLSPFGAPENTNENYTRRKRRQIHSAASTTAIAAATISGRDIKYGSARQVGTHFPRADPQDRPARRRLRASLRPDCTEQSALDSSRSCRFAPS